MRKKEEATNEKIIDAGGSEIAGKRNAEQLESEHKKHRAWKIGILIVLVFAAVILSQVTGMKKGDTK